MGLLTRKRQADTRDFQGLVDELNKRLPELAGGTEAIEEFFEKRGFDAKALRTLTGGFASQCGTQMALEGLRSGGRKSMGELMLRELHTAYFIGVGIGVILAEIDAERQS